jgi:hypothetical protein
MKRQDLRKALRLEEYLKKKHSDLLRDRTEACVFLEEQDSDYTRLDALAKRSGQYSGFADYASQHSLDRPIFRVVLELMELSVVRHAQELDGWSRGVQAPLHRYAAELYYPQLTSKLECQEVDR